MLLLSDGWLPGQSYSFKIVHRPETGLMRLRVWEGRLMIQDSGDIVDTGAESLRGGRLGVYCESQEKITWSHLSYRSTIIIMNNNLIFLGRCQWFKHVKMNNKNINKLLVFQINIVLWFISLLLSLNKLIGSLWNRNFYHVLIGVHYHKF